MRRGRRRPVDRDLAAAWAAAVVPRRARCVVCGGRGALQGHHVISQQAIRSLARTLRLEFEEEQRLLWDARNGIAICEFDHARHTNAVRRIPRALLPPQVFVFVAEVDAMTGLEAVRARLEREYP